MKKPQIILILVCFVGMAMSQCVTKEAKTTNSEPDEELQEVKEREAVEEFLESEFVLPQEGATPDDAQEKQARKQETIREINESTYREMSCADILDSLHSCIRAFEQSGDLDLLTYFSDLQGDSYFRACLRSNEENKKKYNDLYMELGEIRARMDEDS